MHMHIRKYIHIHIYIYIYTHTYIHTYIHTYTQTNNGRHALVQYVCDVAGDNHIESIKEHQVCAYIVRFHSPLLCQHPSMAKVAKPKTKVCACVYVYV